MLQPSIESLQLVAAESIAISSTLSAIDAVFFAMPHIAFSALVSSELRDLLGDAPRAAFAFLSSL